MVSDKAFTGDGTTTAYSIGFRIISDDHVKVFQTPSGGSQSVTNKDDYTVINNSIVFDTAPATSTAITIQVGTTSTDLLTSPTDYSLIATKIDEIAAISPHLSHIDVIASDLGQSAIQYVDYGDLTSTTESFPASTSSIHNVYTNLDDIGILATSSNIADIQDVADSISDVNTLAPHATDIGTLATSSNLSAVSNVNAALGSIADINIEIAGGTFTAVSNNLTAIQNAAQNATTATTQAGVATTQAGLATTQAGVATTQSGLAATAKTASEAAQVSAEAAYNSFDDRYLGAKSTNPTVDNDGNALLNGALYWNSTSSVLRAYDATASVWQDTAPSSTALTNINIVAGDLIFKEDLGLITDSLTTSTGSDISIVAGSIADVNRYANEYTISSSSPGSSSSGDLWYDSTVNMLKYYTGSVWSSISYGGDVVADTTPQLGGDLDCQDNDLTNAGTVSGAYLQIDFGGLT